MNQDDYNKLTYHERNLVWDKALDFVNKDNWEKMFDELNTTIFYPEGKKKFGISDKQANQIEESLKKENNKFKNLIKKLLRNL